MVEYIRELEKDLNREPMDLKIIDDIKHYLNYLEDQHAWEFRDTTPSKPLPLGMYTDYESMG